MDITLGPVPDDLRPVHLVTTQSARTPTDLSAAGYQAMADRKALKVLIRP
jgi:hypothetical protein